MAKGKFTAHYSVSSDIDPSEPVSIGCLIFEDPALRNDNAALLNAIHDADPVCDERIHPMVEVFDIEDVEEEETDEEPEKETAGLISGCWPHIFDGVERNVRFVSQSDGKLLALEIATGLGWRRANALEWSDVEDSLRNGNEEAFSDPETYGLQIVSRLPDWASSSVA